MNRFLRIVCLIMILAGGGMTAQAETTYRFPRPEFESGYQLPETTTPVPPILDYQYLDLGVLIFTLALGAYFVVRRRSRRATFVLMLFALFYFGFWRHAAAYLIRSPQNIAHALADPQYAVPLFVLVCFSLPLLVALFFGRIFCSTVCPFGAIQDILLVRPVKLPRWLTSCLGLPPYVFLGLAVVMAVTGAGFIIGRFNPYMGVFRFGTSFALFMFAGAMLIAAVFIGRPFCRFLCPYGIILSWFSFLSRNHMEITSHCIKCGKCHAACPFNAIFKPTADSSYHERHRASRRYTVVAGLLFPVVVGVAVWAGGQLDGPLSLLHERVRLAQRVHLEEQGTVEGTTLESEAFRQASDTSTGELYRQAARIRQQYRVAGWGLGGFLGTVFMVKILFLCSWPYRDRFSIDKAYCVSCARCVSVCPTKDRV